MNMILHNAERSHTADIISVHPQRAAGTTMASFTVLPGLPSTTEYKGDGKPTLLCINKAIVSFFNPGYASPLFSDL